MTSPSSSIRPEICEDLAHREHALSAESGYDNLFFSFFFRFLKIKIDSLTQTFF